MRGMVFGNSGGAASRTNPHMAESALARKCVRIFTRSLHRKNPFHFSISHLKCKRGGTKVRYSPLPVPVCVLTRARSRRNLSLPKGLTRALVCAGFEPEPDSSQLVVIACPFASCETFNG